MTTRHDSIVLSVPEDVDKATVERILKEDMESADLEFPLEVDVSFGESWSDTKK